MDVGGQRRESEEGGRRGLFPPVVSSPASQRASALSPPHSLSTRALRTARANHERRPSRTRTHYTHTRSRGAARAVVTCCELPAPVPAPGRHRYRLASVSSTSRKPREALHRRLRGERHQHGVITLVRPRRAPLPSGRPATPVPSSQQSSRRRTVVVPPRTPFSHAWRGSGTCSAGPRPRMGTNPPIDARRSIATRTYTRTVHTIAASRTSPLAMLSLAEIFPERVPQVLPWTSPP